MIIGKWRSRVECKIVVARMSRSCEDAFFDKGIEKAEIAKCLSKLRNNKTGGSDGLLGAHGLLKYGGSGMVSMLIRAVIFSCLARGGCPQAMERGPYC